MSDLNTLVPVQPPSRPIRMLVSNFFEHFSAIWLVENLICRGDQNSTQAWSEVDLTWVETWSKLIRHLSTHLIKVDRIQLAELTNLSDLSEPSDLCELTELTELTEPSDLTELTELSDLTELTELSEVTKVTELYKLVSRFKLTNAPVTLLGWSKLVEKLKFLLSRWKPHN